MDFTEKGQKLLEKGIGKRQRTQTMDKKGLKVSFRTGRKKQQNVENVETLVY
jgi:hypothetical protein